MCRAAVLLFLMLAVAAVMVTEAQREPTASKCQAATELAIQILQAVKGAHTGVAAGPHKRNSELINSLLGLPKFMIDAGRR
ncbi:pigment-dispersing hormone type 1-like [Penaeus japonicus]|uniref:Pigment dispersing hormone II n=1 Tax=Penaeus japonicus TaxID=27405 RepID=Q8STA4_PENJP|nr:pigment-dispersing hormone type 1-like [Penaeus japonicus]XP_042885988.1 pigment-dispersing hormone type 1-like [Penaeus japonicus]XP_042885991.1 pigment-dispersing hormone type 1-like [Penaeus japonicus]XP_042885992.1 pigment-dispersing hormone type 1-like [Penaeus japonicus]XP_042885993.1 pigment-dispersing hormone type 1-like [Penaeus japonicus]BAB91011.1 pigment dispersing hormone II [Penaeus japonicus]BAB91013.1 pigment dispersing hormone II [Penaeus japonicus]